MLVRSLSAVNLVAIWVETLLYGIYVVLLVATINVLLFRPLFSRHYPSLLNQAYLAGTFAQFTFSTIHVAAGLAMLLEAFVYRDTPGASSESYFAVVDSSLNTLRATAFLASIAFGDLFMIHRVYILWYRTVAIALIPLVNLVLIVASGILITAFPSPESISPPLFASSSVSIEFSQSLTPTLRTLFPVHIAMSFTTNAWITVLIGIRLWREEDEWAWRRILLGIAETGFLYPVAALIALLSSIAGTNGQIISYTALAPLAAILPTLMILALELDYTTSPSDSPANKSPFSRPRSSSSIAPMEKGLITATTPAATPMTHALSSNQVGSSGLVDEFRPQSVPVASLPLRLPPVPSTPPPVPPFTKARGKEAPVPPLIFAHNRRSESPPPAPHTPTPLNHLPSPFETHFPRHSRFQRASQQTFNPRRESAGRGRAVYTTFGGSSLAMMIAKTKEDGERLPRALVLEAPGSEGEKRDQGEKEKRDKGKKTAFTDWNLPPGVHMTKAVERKIDYIDEEGR